MMFFILSTILYMAAGVQPNDPFSALEIYNGTWAIKAEHHLTEQASGTLDHLMSHCEHFTHYFTCEQTVNGNIQALLVYTAGSAPGKLNCRYIAPDGLAGGRGDLALDGNHWTYLDKPPSPLKGKWSRVENFILDNDTIRFEEYESSDEGKSWTKINFGTETRVAS